MQGYLAAERGRLEWSDTAAGGAAAAGLGGALLPASLPARARGLALGLALGGGLGAPLGLLQAEAERQLRLRQIAQPPPKLASAPAPAADLPVASGAADAAIRRLGADSAV